MRGASVPPDPQARGRGRARTGRRKAPCQQFPPAGLGFPPLLPQDVAPASVQPLRHGVTRLLPLRPSTGATPAPRDAVALLAHPAAVVSSAPGSALTPPLRGPLHGRRGWLPSRVAVGGPRVAPARAVPRAIPHPVGTVHCAPPMACNEPRPRGHPPQTGSRAADVPVGVIHQTAEPVPPGAPALWPTHPAGYLPTAGSAGSPAASRLRVAAPPPPGPAGAFKQKGTVSLCMSLILIV